MPSAFYALMRGGSLIVAFVLFSSSAWAWNPFSCGPSFDALITRKTGNLPFDLAISDHVILTSKGEREKASYLGRRVSGFTGYLIFYMPHKNTIVWVPEKNLRLAGASGTRRFQPLPVIKNQIGPTCMVHSSCNGLQHLESLGRLPESELRTRLNHGSLPRYLHDVVSAEAWVKSYKTAVAGSADEPIIVPPPEWVKRIRRLGYSQADRRKVEFQRNALHVEITESGPNLVRHLLSGMPAFLDVPIAHSEPRPIVMEGAPVGYRDKIWTSYSPAHATHPDGFSWHSVLALGVADTEGDLMAQVLVLDSAKGLDFQLWDLPQVEQAIVNGTSMGASLLRPMR